VFGLLSLVDVYQPEEKERKKEGERRASSDSSLFSVSHTDEPRRRTEKGRGEKEKKEAGRASVSLRPDPARCGPRTEGGRGKKKKRKEGRHAVAVLSHSVRAG